MCTRPLSTVVALEHPQGPRGMHRDENHRALGRDRPQERCALEKVTISRVVVTDIIFPPKVSKWCCRLPITCCRTLSLKGLNMKPTRFPSGNAYSVASARTASMSSQRQSLRLNVPRANPLKIFSELDAEDPPEVIAAGVEEDAPLARSDIDEGEVTEIFGQHREVPANHRERRAVGALCRSFSFSRRYWGR